MQSVDSPLRGDPEPLLTTLDVARLLRVHPKQVYRLFAKGLPRRRVGSEWRFDRDEVLRWSADPTGLSPVAHTAPAPLPPPLIACNGDAAVEILLRRARDGDALLGQVESDREGGIELLRARRVLAAGWHGAEVPEPPYPARRVVRLHLVRRQVGLVGPRGKPPRLESLSSARLVSRPPSAGVRRALDRALERAGLDPARVHDGARIAVTHREVVHAIAAGEADVGIATHAWARRLGLSFTEIDVEDYGLLVHADDLGRPEIVRLCEAAQDGAVRASLAAEAGYDTARTGTLDFSSRAPDEAG